MMDMTLTKEKSITDMDTANIQKAPAPWNLNGKGYIMIFKFPKKFVEKKGCVPDFLKGRYAGGLGAVMLVDYKYSDVGPYGEFLFIPSKFKYKGKRLNTISKIYVSSMDSVVNGRENWGIPKEQADFCFETISENKEHVSITKDGIKIADFIIEAGGPKFPVSTKLMPFPLVQKIDERTLYTNFFGRGTGRLARVRKMRINPKLFPNIGKFTPLAVVKVEPFDITFPVATE